MAGKRADECERVEGNGRKLSVIVREKYRECRYNWNIMLECTVLCYSWNLIRLIKT